MKIYDTRDGEVLDETPLPSKAETPTPQKSSTADSAADLNALRVKVAAIMVRLMLEREQLTPWQNNRHEMLFGGHDAFGLWIYRRPDKTLYGMNYASQERLEIGTIEEHAERHDYPHDLNACAEFEKTLSGIDWDANGLSSWMKYYAALCAECNMRPEMMLMATAEQRCRAFVSVMSPPSPAESENKV